ncbi:MAG: efflux RND transporter periplasmic adaptor subunit [Verrucomicrobiota bacterium]|nr:efflux RND transporter periplasmic adaptor subunit [Verrucomicrobiota bacterium]
MHATATPQTDFTPKPAFWSVTKVIIGIIAVFLLIAGIKASQIMAMIKGGKAMMAAMPPTTVTSAKVEKGNWTPILNAVGSIAPVQGATISAELAGTVEEVGFESGTPIKKGAMLMKLDASAEEAQLRSNQAEAELAKADFERARDLANRKVISQAELDAASAKYSQKVAAVENIKSLIAKKQIMAPFDGIAGIRAVNVGQMVPAGAQLVSLQALDQVYANFSLPQQDLAQVQMGLPVKVTTDAVQGREFDGKLTAVNSAIDQATRSVSVQATLDNSDHALRAGMFARVQVILPDQRPVLFIPATAVSYAPYGNSVYVIEKKQNEQTKKDELVLRQQFIRTGEARGDFIAVTNGLQEGQEVVSTGVFKLRNGMSVAIDNKLAPDAKLNPTPADT